MFNSSRLKVARQRLGLTKRQLADFIDVDPRAVSGFEAGEYEPSLENLSAISDKLGYPIAFFTADDIDIPTAEGVSFRAMSKMTAKQRDKAIAAGAIAYILIDWIEEKFDLPNVDIPDLREDSPETAALSLRQHWGLGLRPIKNMIHLLENFGIRVFSLSEDCHAIDAYSIWRGQRPCIFLNTEKSAERSRFDAAHELGHLVLHKHAAPTGLDAEKEADAFAGALLMPEESLLATQRIKNIDELVQLKSHWKISIAAMTYRSHQLGLLSKWQYQTIFKEISQRGWRSQEPFPIKRETSQVWKKVFSFLREENISVEDLAAELMIPVDEIVRLVFGLVTIGMPSQASTITGKGSTAHLRIIK